MNQKKELVNYIDKNRMYDLVVSLNNDTISNREIRELGKMVILLVNRIASRPNFNGYTYIDEMKSNAICDVWKAIRKFDPTKSSNAFSYFTTVVFNSFVFIINSERGVLEKNKMYLNHVMETGKFDTDRYAKKRFTSEIKDKLN